MEPGTLSDALKVALDRGGLPRIRVHDLRHTTATVLLEAGVHPKLVQHLLGHSTVALTLNTYSHVTPGLSGEAARTMDQLFGGGDVDTDQEKRSPAPQPPSSRRFSDHDGGGADLDQ